MFGPRRLLLVLLISLLALPGCKKNTPTPSTEIEDPGALIADYGTAMLIYEYKYEDMPAWVSSAYVDFLLHIDMDLQQSPNGPWNVEGDEAGVLYTQYYGEGGPSGGCFIQCDFSGTYSVRGTLSRVPGTVDECQFKLKMSAVFDPNEINRYGDCPEPFLSQFDCSLLVQFPHSDDWVLGGMSDPLVATAVPHQNATEKVTITEIDLAEGNWCQW